MCERRISLTFFVESFAVALFGLVECGHGDDTDQESERSADEYAVVKRSADLIGVFVLENVGRIHHFVDDVGRFEYGSGQDEPRQWPVFQTYLENVSSF